jgi:uncharacterized protein (DUF1800 family)
MPHPFVPLGSSTIRICAILAGLTCGQALAAPVLRSAASRVSHAGQTFDVALPLSGGSGIECRDMTRGTSIVMTFTEPVVSADVNITAGTAKVASAPTVIGNTIVVPLTEIENAQPVTLGLTNIVGAAGPGANASLTLRFLSGDLNADAVVDAKDSQIAQDVNGQTTNGGNYRADANESGSINSLDATRLRSRRGSTVAGGATSNTAPTVTGLASSRELSGGQMLSIPITVGDAESSADAVYVSATSSDQQVIPDSSLGISGQGTQRMLVISGTGGKPGEVKITVVASDGLGRTTQTTSLKLRAPNPVYGATVRPAGAVQSLGSGLATLELAADQTYATIRYSFTNLRSQPGTRYIRGPADPGAAGDILFDLGAAPVQADGSYKWTFAPVGSYTVPDQIAAIQQGRTYIAINSVTYPTESSGEIRGQFLFIDQATPFVQPAPAPALATGPLSDADASRFLVQATFGPTEQTMAQLKAMGINAWLEQQFNTPRTSHLTKLKERLAEGQELNGENDDLYTEVWWNIALNSPDQLRQRVTFALSEIMVISQVDPDLQGHADSVASYVDMLSKNAFGNFRTLLEGVTLHPSMGQYLDMRGSKKASGTNKPNENYPREIMQLFSIGLQKVHPDGTTVLDASGLPIATYGQDEVSELARAFTGWNWHQAGTGSSPGSNYLDPMTPTNTNDHDTGAKTLFDPTIPPATPAPVIIPASQTIPKDLADAHNALFNHPATGPFICRKLIQRLVCSNPSPGYVYRVSQVFANNGQGVRGDMKAVIKAILTDYEARSNDVLSYQGYGRLKEPVLRWSQVMRALHVQSNSGLFRSRNTDVDLAQSPLRAPTVFNFFEPDFIYPGTLSDNGLFGPEFQITNETQVLNMDNFFWDGVRFANSQTNSAAFNPTDDLRVDLTTESNLASNSALLLDRLNKILMSGQMSSALRQRIIDYLASSEGAALNSFDKARRAVHFVVTSPEFAVQK